MKIELLEKIESQSLRIGIVGLGYVGLPLAMVCARSNFKTLGFDVSESKVALLKQKKNYIDDVEEEELSRMVEQGMFSATTDFSELANIDLIIICVPTPLDHHQQPNTTYIEEAGHMISRYLKKNSLIVLESTTYPGTTRDLLKPCLEANGLICEEDFYLGFSPERVDPGNQTYATHNTTKVVGAIGLEAAEVITKAYEAILDGEVYTVASPEIAEMEKILENTYRNVNIGLINELTILCDKIGINIWEVIDAAATKPYGFQAFYPGPGLGGHCIPLDPYYLSWKAREYGFHTSMIESSMMINDQMPEYTVQRVSRVLNQHQKPLNGSRILVLGIAYKKDISDYRESPALDVMKILEREQADVTFFDPYVAERIDDVHYKRLNELAPEVLGTYDLVLITTAHSCVDYEQVQKYAPLIFDTRHATKNLVDRENIILL